MKKIALVLLFTLLLGMLAGCMGTPVVYSACTCPQESTPAPTEPAATEPAATVPADGTAVKTGLAILANSAKSVAGTAEYDVTLVAVNVDDKGIITACKIDSVGTKVSFDTAGAITSDLTAPILTTNELGADYGMVAWGKAKAEWNEQAAAFAAYVTGKTAQDVAGIAVTDTTKPEDGTDLANSVTIKIGDFQTLIAKAMQG